MLRAIVLGSAIVMAAGTLYFVPLAGVSLPEWLLATASAAPLAGAFLATWIAPSRKVLAGTLMVVPAVVVALGVTAIYQALGKPVDFGGLSGAKILAGLTVAWSLPACFVVAALSAWLSGVWKGRRRSAASPGRDP